MTPVTCYVSAAFGRHDPGLHPEQPARYEAVLRAIAAAGPAARQREAPPATAEALARVHDPRFVEALERLSHFGGGPIDPDTVAVPVPG